MTEIRVYPEKDLACIVTEVGAVDSADNILWSNVDYTNRTVDDGYEYIRMKLSDLMTGLEETLRRKEHS